jgi:hypothetical protein
MTTRETPLIHLDPVREPDGESCWETCRPADAQAWRVAMIYPSGLYNRAWTYKRRTDAERALSDLKGGRIQPLQLTGFASNSPRTVYLP